MKPLAGASVLVRELADVAEVDLAHVGAKAGRLGVLRRAGFRVPDGFCITVSAFNDCMSRAGLDRWWELGSEERRRRIAEFEEQRLPAELDDRLTRAYRALVERCGGSVSLAVRSSGILEDASSNSFAGVYETVLQVRGEEALRAAVKRCWLSAITDEVLAYLARFGYEPESNGMAVLVQEMIEGEVSGVMFTANPATGNPFEICIDAVPGICEPLVSGAAAEARLVLDRRQPEKAGATHDLLPERRVRRLLETADAVERCFGGEPQDIEWGSRGEQVYVLQSRPVTALPDYFPVDETLIRDGRSWKLAFVGLFSPFGCSLERIKNEVYVEALFRATGRRLQGEQAVVNGYLYDSTREPGSALTAPLRLFKVTRDLLTARRVAERFETVARHYLETMESTGERAGSENRPQVLIDILDEQIAAYLAFQRDSIAVVNLANMFPRLFKRFCLVRGLTNDGLAALSLLQGEENATLERDTGFDELCERLRGAGLAPTILEAPTWEAVREKLGRSDAGRAFLEAWDAFLLRYGYTWTTGNPKDPGWREDGGLVLSSLQAALAHTGEGPAARLARAAQERATAEGELRAPLGPLGRTIFDRLLRRAREYFPVRENRNHLFYRGVSAMRTTLRRLGSLLVRDGHVADIDDVFLLTRDELQRTVSAGAWEELRRIADDRRQEYARCMRLQPPPVLGGKPAPEVAGDESQPAGRQLQGQACSPGTARGAARIVHTPREMGRLRGGEILVVPKLRPYFATLLGVAGGLVTEEGSLLSHGANLAREYRIPAVLGVRGVTRSIKDGDRLVVNGTEGSVIVESAAPSAGGS